MIADSESGKIHRQRLSLKENPWSQHIFWGKFRVDMSPPLPATKDGAQLNMSDSEVACAYVSTGYGSEKYEKRDSFAFVG